MELGSIHDAASKGDLEAVKKIVEQEPSRVNEDDEYEWRPIFHAGLRRHYDVVKYLIDYNGPQYLGHELSKIYRLTHTHKWRSEYVNPTDSSYSKV